MGILFGLAVLVVYIKHARRFLKYGFAIPRIDKFQNMENAENAENGQV